MPSRKASRKASEAKKVLLSWVSGSRSCLLDGRVVAGVCVCVSDPAQPVFQGDIFVLLRQSLTVEQAGLELTR